MNRRLNVPVLLGLVLLVSASVSQISLPRPPKLPGIPGLDLLVKEEPPITTSLKDALTEIPYLDGFDPRSAISLSVLKRSQDGVFKVFPGVFSFEAQSYCMHAGTHGPGSGEGYLLAPLKGPKQSVIRGILQKSVSHPEIPQSDVQQLIWAILARTKPSKLSGDLRQTATQLISEKDLGSLEGSGWDLLKENSGASPFVSLPGPIRQVMEAENNLRSMFYSASAPFEELERVAVLTGEYQPRKDDRPVPKGRWSYHAEGYFVRYVPHGYSHTTQHLYFPEQFTTAVSGGVVAKITDPAGRELRVEGGQVVYSENGKEMGRSAFSPAKPASDKRKGEFGALLKKLKKGGEASELAAIADVAAAFDSRTEGWQEDAREMAILAWMSALHDEMQGRESGLFAMFDPFMPVGPVEGGFDPSGGVATPGQTGRQRLAQSSRCNAAGSASGDSGDGQDFKRAVVDAMRAKGYDVGPENVYVYDQRDSGGLLRFVVRMSRDGKPLPTGACIEEQIARGNVPPGSLEGAKEMLFGSAQFAGSMKRVGVRTVDVETGVITGAGKGDGTGLNSATNNAFQDYVRW